MDIGKTGSILFRMYSGTVVLMWGVMLLMGGGLLLYMGFEPFRIRAYVMIGIGTVILSLSFLSMMGGKKTERFADDARRAYDADEAIRRYLQHKSETVGSEPAVVTDAVTPLPPPATPPAPQRPVFGRRGTA